MTKTLDAGMVSFIENARANTSMTWNDIYFDLHVVYNFVSDAEDKGGALAKMYKRYVDSYKEQLDACKKMFEEDVITPKNNSTSIPQEKRPEITPKQQETCKEEKDDLDVLIDSLSDSELIALANICEIAANVFIPSKPIFRFFF